MERFTRTRVDKGHGTFLRQKEIIRRETQKLRNMHPKELSTREKLQRELTSGDIASPKEQVRLILDKYGKLNDRLTFKAKFYKILSDRIHEEGSFRTELAPTQPTSLTLAEHSEQSFRPTKPRRKGAGTPMVHFQGLSNCFDEEAKLGPLKIDRVLSVQKRFDTQLA